MEYKKLGDIATYINGYPFKPEDRGECGLPIIRIQDLTGNTYDLGYYDGKYPERIEINNGDILISWSASLGVYVWNRGKALLNQHIFKVVFNKGEINKRYFVYAVQFKLKEMEAKTHGATMKHIVKKDFDSTLIPYPSLKEQSRIAEIIDSIAKSINMRQKQLQKLDDLVKARFVELFGNPLIESGRYPKVPLGGLTEVGSSKRIFEKEYVGEGVPFYRTKEIVELSKGNRITTELFITKERYDEIRSEYGVPQKGDLLISAVGTIGVIWIVDGKNDFYYKDGNLLRVSATERFVPEYLKHLLEALIGAYKSEMSSGTAYAALTISALKEMMVYDVPYAKQKQFAAFVTQTDKSKAAIQKALDEAQLLFDSLMQQYFS